MAGLQDIAKEVGLSPLKLDEGTNVDTSELVEALFEKIIELCSKHEVVRIKNFGTFRAKVIKGRTLKTPLLEGGEITYPDQLVLKFKQSAVTKRTLNVPAIIDEWTGKKPKKSKKKDAAPKKPKKKDAAPKKDKKDKKSKKKDAAPKKDKKSK